MSITQYDLNTVYKDLPIGFDQTVPWPRVWLLSRDGAGIKTVGGGVRTGTLRAVPEKPRDGEHSRKKADQYPYTVASRVEGMWTIKCENNFKKKHHLLHLYFQEAYAVFRNTKD